jgi:3alpha(or 20beta)-hydroxysteroid dehydrogenase
MFQLTGKIIIITGAARGQGTATAELFASQGGTVIMTDRSEEEGKAVAQRIGGSTLFEVLDVGSELAWDGLIQTVLSQFGKIDVLVNNAGISCRLPIVETSRQKLDEILNVNLIGTYLGMRAVIPAMTAAGRGSIVNIASVNAFRGTCYTSAYDASKWAVRGLTKAAAVELAPAGIRVNSVHPGAIDTPMLNPRNREASEIAEEFRIGIGRPGRSEEVAAATLFLASDEASYVSGAELAVDGGWSAGTYLGDVPKPNRQAR